MGEMSDKLMGRKPRPLKPGEFVQNEDGSRSTERTATVTDPRINKGKPTLIPTIFKVGDDIVEHPFTREGVDRAADMAIQSKQIFPSFNSIEEADAEAEARSKRGGNQRGALGKTMNE